MNRMLPVHSKIDPGYYIWYLTNNQMMEKLTDMEFGFDDVRLGHFTSTKN